MPKINLVKRFPENAQGRLVTTSRSSDIIPVAQAPKSILAEPGVLRDVLVFTDGINAATVTIYDHASAASGTVLAKIIVAGSDLMGGEVNIDVEADNGIYITLSGAGASALVRYIP